MDRPIKVVHMIGGGEYGGAENHIIQLLSSFSPDKIDASVICFYESAFSEALRKKGIEVNVLDYPRFDPRIAIGLGRVLQRLKPDILHTHGVKANFFGRIMAKRVKNVKNVKIITTVHSHLKHDYDRWPIKLLTYLMEHGTRRFNDHFICVSSVIKEELVTSGVDRDRISVVPNGIELDRFAHLSHSSLVKEELDIPQESFVVGAVARLRHVKGIHLLIEAAKEIISDREDVHIVVIGEGPQRMELENRAKNLGLSQQIHFLGFKENVEEYVVGFDCFANVSLSEGLPLAVLEAMACKVPVVATSVGAVPEIIHDGTDGVLVESNSIPSIVAGLKRVMESETLRQSMVERAYEKVIRIYNTNVMSQRNQEIYQKMMEG